MMWREPPIDVQALRMAHARRVNPDVRELKRCGWATRSDRHAPCELPMGHPASQPCYNGDEKREIEASIERMMTPEICAQLDALRPPEGS
jgi:hypothetical protein